MAAKTILALAIGITASTTFVTMNSTFVYIAFPAYYLPPLGTKTTTPESSAILLLRQWALTYGTGHAVGPYSLIIGTAAFSYALMTTPVHMRALLVCATVSTAVGFFFTVAFMLSINNELYRRAHPLEFANKEEQLRIATGDTQVLIQKCLWLSGLRAVMPVPAIVLGMYVMFRLMDELER